MAKFALFIFILFSISCTPETPLQDFTVVSLLDANIAHLDPIHSTNKYSSTINSSIFEGLYHYHYLKRPITVEPKLAAQLPKISKNKMVYEIKIKKGVLFQDDPAFPDGKGRELTANDFIYSWKRLADPKNKALGWWVFDGLIKGLNDWRDKLRKGQANYETPVEGLKAIDPHTLVIELTRPSFQFFHYLAMPVTMVVAQEVVNHYGSEIINHPVGTGPFQLESWTRNSQVVLVKNKSYREELYPSEGTKDSKAMGHLKDSGKRLPLSEKVIVKIMRERQPEWLSFLKGQIDHGIIPPENYEQLFTHGKMNKELAEKEIRIHDQYRPDVTYIAFNMEDPILGKNKHLRRALYLAVDHKLALKKFYNNRGVIAQSPIPPNLDGYDPNYRNPNQYNLKQAKQEMILAGYPDGKGLPIFNYELSNVGTWSRQYSEFLKDQWAQIGVKVKIVPNTYPQFDKKVKNKMATIFNMAWLADYPDSENFFQLFYSKNVSPGSNSFNFINRHYDKLYEKAILLPPSDERNKIFTEMVQFINEEIPAIFAVHRVFKLPYHGWLENYNEFTMIYDSLQYLKVNPKKKSELIKKL